MSGKVRLMDIARLAGVSKVTVSKVLNPTPGNRTVVSEGTAARVNEIAKALDYRPNLVARQLAGGWSKMLGVLIDAGSAPTELVRVSHAVHAAEEYGYRFIIGECHNDLSNIRAYLDDFASRGADGVIIHANSFPSLNAEIVEAARKLKYVMYYDQPICDDGTLDFVHVDFSSGVRRMVDHLYEHGRYRMVYFAPYPRLSCGKYRSQQERERGFAEGMRAHKLELDPDFASRYFYDKMPPSAEIIEIAMNMIKEQRPDAVIARNDDYAAMVLCAINKLGLKCPDDIAVAGYDNMPFAEYLIPTLTTIDNELHDLSRLVVEKMIAKIEKKIPADQPVRIFREPRLVIRETT